MKIRHQATLLLLLILASCGGQQITQDTPFSIEEKYYYHWVGGKQGTKGTTIEIGGSIETLNISFSKIYFQNHEYEVVPDINNLYFRLVGNRTEFRNQDKVMSSNPADEYGNQAPKTGATFPFDLKDDEAVIMYTLSGREGFLKVTGIKQMDTVYKP